jgi:hypothetical protein
MYTVSIRRLQTPQSDRAPAHHPRKRATEGRKRHYDEKQTTLRAQRFAAYGRLLGTLYAFAGIPMARPKGHIPK